MIWLADTNVLLRWSDRDNPHHPECADAVNRLIDQGDQVCTCAQVLIEYWVDRHATARCERFRIERYRRREPAFGSPRFFPLPR